MLTSLDFLNQGKPWPPPSERERLSRYAYNRRLFDNDCDDKYKEQAKRIERVIGDYQGVISYHLALNYPKRVSIKTADLLLSEAPKIEAGEQTKKVDEIVSRSDLFSVTRETVLDISMCGDGLFYVRKTGHGGIVDIAAPETWFPVVSPDNVKEVMTHVLAWTYSVGENESKEWFLKQVIHEKGKYTERINRLNGKTIGPLVEEERTKITGLDDFAIIHIPNITTSRQLFGADDYGDIDTIVSELEIRFDQIAKVLDKHTDPTMQGPASALVDDGMGHKIFPAGNYISNMDEYGNTSNVSYLTWDAQMSANFQMIDKLIDQLYTQSEMGAAIFGDVANKSGSIPSGSALRRMMISPLAKVARVREKLDPALKKAIKMAAQLDGDKIDDISITWQDGLPDDPKESAEIMQIRTGGKATISQYSAIKQMDNRTDKDTDAELELIRQDDEIANAGLGQAVDTTPYAQEEDAGDGDGAWPEKTN